MIINFEPPPPKKRKKRKRKKERKKLHIALCCSVEWGYLSQCDWAAGIHFLLFATMSR